MSCVLKEPVKRKIVFLMLIVFVAFATIISVDAMLRSLTVNSNKAIANQYSRRNLGRVLLDKLTIIEHNHHTLISLDDSRGINVCRKRILSAVTDIEEVLEVLRNGGVYEDIRPTIFGDLNEIREQIPLTVDKDADFVVEVIDLTPKIMDIKQISVKLVKMVAEKFSSKDKTESQCLNKSIGLFLKQAEVFLLSSRESVNKLFHDAQLQILSMEKQRDKSTVLFAWIRCGVVTMVAIIGLFTVIRTISQIGVVIEDRKRSQKELAEHRDHLEQLVEQRTSDVTKANRDLLAENRWRKQAQKELSLIHVAVNNATDAIVIMDWQGEAAYINTAFTNLFGYTREQVRKISIRQIFADSNKAGKVLSLNTKNKGWQGEIELTDSTGRVFPAFVRSTAIIHNQANIESMLLVISDITEQKLKESQLRQAQKLESIGQLASGIAHEINTPIQYVSDNTRFLNESCDQIASLLNDFNRLLDSARKGNVPDELIDEIVKSVGQTDPESLFENVHQAIGQSLEGLERVTNIVGAMKDFSHPGAGVMTGIDINRIMDSSITICRNEWKFVADIETHYDTSLPAVTCLPDQIGQVFLNLIVNAAHAIKELSGDTPKKKGIITISTRKDGQSVEIRVSDTGCGIPPENQSRIFDPFFTTKDVGKGTGQGLAMVNRVVTETHGGTITFESNDAKGTTFIVRLPFK